MHLKMNPELYPNVFLYGSDLGRHLTMSLIYDI